MVIVLKMEQFGFTSGVMFSNGADGIANNVGSDQTAEQSDLALHCLLRPTCLSI